MLRIRCDRVASKLEDVDDISRDDRPSFPCGVFELGTIVELTVADFVGTRSIQATLPQEESDDRRQVFIEVDLHRVKRTSPGYCFSITSGVSAAFASILAWTSSP